MLRQMAAVAVALARGTLVLALVLAALVLAVMPIAGVVLRALPP